MGIVLATTAGLVLWIILWSIGWKAIDGAMLAIVIILTAQIVVSVQKYLPGNRKT